VLGSAQLGEKTQQSLAEGRGSRRETQTVLISTDTEAASFRGRGLSGRLPEGQGAGLRPPGLPAPGQGVTCEGNWILGFTQ